MKIKLLLIPLMINCICHGQDKKWINSNGLGYIQDSNIVIANYLVKKDVIDKNYIIINGNTGFNFDTVIKNELNYSKYFTKFILKEIDKGEAIKIECTNNNFNLQEDFYSSNTSLVFSPIVVGNNRFYLIKNIRSNKNYNYSQLFMIMIKIQSDRIKVIKQTGVYE